MRRLLRAAAAACVVAGAVALGGCNLTFSQVDSTTDKVVQAFQAACTALPTAHQNFIAIATAFSVKQSVIDKETAVYNQAVAICASGAITDVAGAVKTVNGAIQQISAATTSTGS